MTMRVPLVLLSLLLLVFGGACKDRRPTMTSVAPSGLELTVSPTRHDSKWVNVRLQLINRTGKPLRIGSGASGGSATGFPAFALEHAPGQRFPATVVDPPGRESLNPGETITVDQGGVFVALVKWRVEFLPQFDRAAPVRVVVTDLHGPSEALPDLVVTAITPSVQQGTTAGQ